MKPRFFNKEQATKRIKIIILILISCNFLLFTNNYFTESLKFSVTNISNDDTIEHVDLIYDNSINDPKLLINKKFINDQISTKSYEKGIPQNLDVPYAFSSNLIVTIDYTHNYTPAHQANNLESNLTVAGVSSVNTLDTTFSIPVDTNILLFPASNSSYDTSELNSINSWFNGGGAEPRLLWVAGDSDYLGFFNNSPSNEILEKINSNLRLSSDSIYDPINNDGADYRLAAQTPLSNGIINSNLTSGVSSIIMHGPSSVIGYQSSSAVDLNQTSIPGVEVIMKSSTFSWANDNDSSNGIFDYYTINNLNGSYPMVVIQDMGNQNYVIVSGEVIFSDYYHMYDLITNNGIWNGGSHDGKILVDNIFNWFSKEVGFKTIAIDGNDELISFAQIEGWTGDGSKSNPYLIQDYTIIGTGTGTPIDPYNPPPVDMNDPYRILIEINNTDLFVKISNNTLIGAGDSAIVFRNVTNGIIENNSVSLSTRHAIRLSESNNITVFNNSIFSNGGIGLGLWFSNNSKIIQNTLYDNGVNGIYTVGTRFNNIEKNIAYNNIWHGIALDYYSENNTVLSNEIFGNGREGIGFWDHSSLNVIEFNQIKNNNWDPVFGFGGIAGWDSPNNVISDNLIENNSYGIYFASSNNTVIAKNDIFNNSLTGISIETSIKTELTSNTVNNNTGFGIYVHSGSDNTTILSNNVYNNVRYVGDPLGGTGIYIENSNFNKITSNMVYYQIISQNPSTWGITIIGSSENVLAFNKIYNTEFALEVDSNSHFNKIIGNEIFDNVNSVSIFGDNNNIKENEFHNNQMAGIFLSGTSWTIIEDNFIYNNGQQGIFMVDSDNSLISGNTVHGNLASGIDFANVNFVSVSNNIVYQNNIGIFLEVNCNYFYITSNIVYHNGLNAEIQLLNTNNHNIIEKNDILESAVDQGTNNSFSSNHWAGWLSSNPYTFTGNQDQTPSSVPYHFSEPILTSISYNILDKKVEINWQSSTDTLGHGISYSLYMSTDEGLTWELFASSLSGTSYTWDVSSLSDGLTVNVKIEAKDNVGFLTENITDTPFVISNPKTSTTPPTTTPPTTTPPDSTSKPGDSSTITTTTGLEFMSILLSLIGIFFIRMKRKY